MYSYFPVVELSIYSLGRRHAVLHVSVSLWDKNISENYAILQILLRRYIDTVQKDYHMILCFEELIEKCNGKYFYSNKSEKADQCGSREDEKSWQKI